MQCRSHTPSVSVVMPVYNGEQYIAAAINSLLQGTLQDFELLIIDDGSTDNSRSIATTASRCDKRVHVLDNVYGKGISGALNTGLHKARAPFIARADADDINVRSRLQRQYNFLQDNEAVHLVGGGYAPFNETGIRRRIFHPRQSLEIAWRFIGDSFFCHPSVMFRRSIIDEFGGYPDGYAAEDYAFFSRIVRKYKCYNLARILVYYREHSLNLSKVRCDEISHDRDSISSENFTFFAETHLGKDIFLRYLRTMDVPEADLSLVNSLNKTIVKKIRDIYGIPRYALESIVPQTRIRGHFMRATRRARRARSL